MAFPETIYTEYVRYPDTRVRWYSEVAGQNAALANLSCLIEIPRDYDLHVQILNARATAGAAQTVSNCFISYQRVSGGNQATLYYRQTPAAPIVEVINENWQGVIIPEGSIVNFLGNFNAGVAANNVNIHLYGLLLPRMEFLA